MKNRICIIRCDRAGVFFGKIEKLEGRTATIRDCRRIWYWEGAASLSQLALEGTKQPHNCKFTVTVPELVVLDVIEVIPCSDAAIENISKVPVWKV